MKGKTVYFCSNCGNEFMKWQGKCPACGQWNTISEHKITNTANYKSTNKGAGVNKPKRLSVLDPKAEIRFSTGMTELDRVLGGGAVVGSLVLVGGAPGIGKSTLLLQFSARICKDRKVLYVSGEESESQLKMRAERLNINGDDLFVLSETSMDDVLAGIDDVRPDVLIIDSIQTLYMSDSTSAPGSISQVKECTMTLMRLAKSTGLTIFIVGHINKEGAIAGPMVLEHMVDCVLFFEGDKNTSYRLISAAKNRFGSTNELGVFEMQDYGLEEVQNASEMLLAGRPINTPGTCVACIIEGSRPILAEIQALVVESSFNNPRRTTDGFDYNRAALLMAVLEKRGNLKLSAFDGYINVIGGLNIQEPAADLPLILAISSCYFDKPLPSDLAAIGEVGLTGEIRSVTQLTQRLSEISRLGFHKVIIPKQGSSKVVAPMNVELIPVNNISEAMTKAFGNKNA